MADPQLDIAYSSTFTQAVDKPTQLVLPYSVIRRIKVQDDRRPQVSCYKVQHLMALAHVLFRLKLVPCFDFTKNTKYAGDFGPALHG